MGGERGNQAAAWLRGLCDEAGVATRDRAVVERRVLAALCVPLVPYLLVYGKWQDLGGWCWGPRYLTPVTPIVVLLAAWAVRAATTLKRSVRAPAARR